MERVSVIVPVYNQAKTVVRAIQSVLTQDYGDIEIIVINDGSTDSTESVLARYKDKISIITHRESKGLYKSRFKGISKATGDWISFVDSDDELSPTAISESVATARHTKADIVQMKIERRSKRLGIKLPIKQGYDVTRALDAVCYNDALFPVQCWGKIYSSQLIKESEESFIPYDGFWGEDRMFNLSLLSQHPDISICHNAIYRYNWGGATTMYADRLTEFSQIRALKIKYLTEKNLLTPDLRKSIDAEFIRHVRYNTRQMINSGHNKDEIIKGLEMRSIDGILNDQELSPSDIYSEEKQSVSRKLKHIVHQLI